MKITGVADLQAETSRIVKLAEDEGVVPISRNGRTVAFLVSREKFAGLLETMELQKQPELMELVRKDKAGEIKYTPVPNEV